MDHLRIARLIYGEPWGIRPSTYEAIQSRFSAFATDVRQVDPIHRTQRNHFSAQQLGLQPPASRDSRVYRKGQLAYIPVSGIIGKHLSLMDSMCGGYDLDQLQSDIAEVSGDMMVNNVLIDFDSPGGLLTGLPETAAMLAQLRRGGKQLFGFTETQVCSAAYWLYSQCEYRYATPSSEVGAVGVYVYLLDRTKQLEQQGITPVLIKAGKFKGAGLPGNPLTDEERQMIQDQVTMLYDMMVADIQAVHVVGDAMLQGQMFIGQQALNAGLVDDLWSSLDRVVSRLS